jgi:hypothetical protein
MSTALVHSDQDHSIASRKFQEYYENELRDVGGRVPPRTIGQTLGSYRRESCRQFKRTFLPQNHPLYGVQWRGLRNDALDTLEPQLLQACVEEANNPNTVPPGEFRKIEVRNPYGQLQMTKFIGPEHFCKAMGRPGRRVVKFREVTDWHGRPVR